MQFLFVIYHRRELFQIKCLTWLPDRTLLVGDSRDMPKKEVLFDLPTSRVHDLCQRAARRQQETEREQILRKFALYTKLSNAQRAELPQRF
jgi:hypothetical protein